jgi:hypothetical protein
MSLPTVSTVSTVFYIDGSLIGTTTQFTNTGVLGDALTIGANRTPSNAMEGRFQGQIDNVQVIPEPSAALIGGLGLLALLRRRRG